MKKRLKGYSLPWAIFIMVIVSIMLSSLILLRSISRDVYNRTKLSCSLISDVDYGIEYGLSQTSDILDSIMLNGPNPIIVKRSTWGYFNIVFVSGQYNKFYKSKAIISSSLISKTKTPSLVVNQARSTVSLTGNTLIEGNIFVPKGYLERAYIEGKSFSRKKLCRGKIMDSKLYIDYFDRKSFVDRYKSIISSVHSKKSMINNVKFDSLLNSFGNETIVLYNSSFINLKNINLSGNIIVRSDSLIVIKKNCIIKNSIISAPIIVIEDGFIGQVQIIANDSVHIGEKVQLGFPSAIILTDPSGIDSYITIEKRSIIDGFIYAISSNRSLISISDKALVNGHIYSNSCVDCRGTINGSLICNKLTTKTKSSFYESILIDTKISNIETSNMILAGLAFSNKTNEQALIELKSYSK